MLENLWILLFIVEIDWLKSIRTSNWLTDELAFAVAIRLANSNFIHNATHLFLGVFDLVESDIKDHANICELIALLANLD